MCFLNVLIVPTTSIVITVLFHEHVCTCNKLFYLILWSSIDKGLNSPYNLNEAQILRNGSDGWQQSCLSFNTGGRLQIKSNGNKICNTEEPGTTHSAGSPDKHETDRQGWALCASTWDADVLRGEGDALEAQEALEPCPSRSRSYTENRSCHPRESSQLRQ